MDSDRTSADEGARWQRRGRDDDFPWRRWAAVLCLSGVAIYRERRESTDPWEAAFVTGALTTAPLLVGVLAALDRAPPQVVGDARRRRSFKVAVSALGTTLSFACTYCVKTTMSPAVSFALWGTWALVTYRLAAGSDAPEAYSGESPDESAFKERV